MSIAFITYLVFDKVCTNYSHAAGSFVFTSYNSRVTFGPGTGAIIFDEVDCDGTEVSLRVPTCLSRFSRPEYCHHRSDVGVRCDCIGSSGECYIVLQLIIAVLM